LLPETKVQEVISLLEQGLSRRRIAKVAGVNESTIYRIENNFHQPVRRDLTLSPCPKCARQADSAPISPGADSFCFTAKQRERYENMRRKVEAEIAAGIRTPSGYIEFL
jgi:DNA-binding XRE family transcriptional regulator